MRLGDIFAFSATLKAIGIIVAIAEEVLPKMLRIIVSTPQPRTARVRCCLQAI